MTADVVILPVARIERTPDAPPPPPILSSHHRIRMKELASEWGVSLETAVVIMVAAYIDAEVTNA